MKTLNSAFWSLLAVVLVATVTLSPRALAQPATLEGGILKIPAAAAIIDGEVQYYNDVELAIDDAGSFVVVKRRGALWFTSTASLSL
jgi:hypothetical protein